MLSDSTEAFDRGDKFADYRRLESLKEYVLISQNTKRVDTFSKNEQEQWLLQSYQESEQLTLNTLEFSCLVSDIYEDITEPNE